MPRETLQLRFPGSRAPGASADLGAPETPPRCPPKWPAGHRNWETFLRAGDRDFEGSRTMESRGSQTPNVSLGPSAERLPVTLPGCAECLEEGDRSPFHAGCYFRKTEENNRRLFCKGSEPAEQGSCLGSSECRSPCSAFFRDEVERPTLGWS